MITKLYFLRPSGRRNSIQQNQQVASSAESSLLDQQLRVLRGGRHIAAQPDGVRISPQRFDTKGDVLLERQAELFGTFADVLAGTPLAKALSLSRYFTERITAQDVGFSIGRGWCYLAGM